MKAVPIEVSLGVERIRAVVARWWLLLLLGVVTGLGVAAAEAASAHVSYTATAVGLVDEPPLTLDQQNGTATVVKLNDLMPTFASLGTGDVVLHQVDAALSSPMSLAALRGHLSVTVLAQTLELNITASFPDATEAVAAAQADLDGLGGVLAAYGGPGTSSSRALKLSEVQAPTVVALRRHASRILAIGGVLGLALAALVAFAVDRA